MRAGRLPAEIGQARQLSLFKNRDGDRALETILQELGQVLETAVLPGIFLQNCASCQVAIPIADFGIDLHCFFGLSHIGISPLELFTRALDLRIAFSRWPPSFPGSRGKRDDPITAAAGVLIGASS